MQQPPTKDILFVSIQLLLFLCYFLSPLQISFQPHQLFKYLALVIFIIGFLIILTAILQLSKNLTPFPTPKANGTLIQTGLYKFVRHPIYSGIFLSAVGYGIFDGSVWKISIGCGLLILFYFKSKYEENQLVRKFPYYVVYRMKTGRFFPYFIILSVM